MSLFPLPRRRPEEDSSAPEGYLQHFRILAHEYIQNAYGMEHPKRWSAASGALSTSLPETVVSLIKSQTSILEGSLIAVHESPSLQRRDLFEEGVLHLLECQLEAQTRYRPLLLSTFDDTCAAASDFLRMSEEMEVFVRELVKQHQYAEDKLGPIGHRVVHVLLHDAVYAAECGQIFIMREIQQRTLISSDLLCKSWEDDWTHNEVARALTRTFDQFLVTMEKNLANEFLFRKALITAAKAMVCFYVRCLAEKADWTNRRRNKWKTSRTKADRKPFSNLSRALIRMRGDIFVIEDYFEEKASGNVTAKRIISHEILILKLIHEFLDAADWNSLESFILVLHQRTGADLLVTRHFVGDLWLLAGRRGGRRAVDKCVAGVLPDLQLVTVHLKERSAGYQRADVAYVSLDEMLKVLYEDRIARSILPACWALLPKADSAHGDRVSTAIVRSVARNFDELRRKRKSKK